MQPNWALLIYLVAQGLCLVALFILASLSAVYAVYGWLGGKIILPVDNWLAVTAVMGLGILPWPGLIALGRAILRPRKPPQFGVRRHRLGSIAATLTALDDEEAVQAVVQDFARHPKVASVIVVDNGSTDRTAELATAAGAHVVREHRKGYGYACQRALRAGVDSGYPIVVLCEADRTFRADDIDQLAAYLQYADLVIGSRTHGALLNSDSQLNSFFILGNLLVAKLLQARYWDWTIGGRLRLTDVGCTYLAVRNDALRRILPNLAVGNSHFIPHLLLVALERGLRMVQVPVTFWRRVGVSKGGNANWRNGFVLGLAMVWHILTYRVPRGAQVDPAEAGEDALQGHATALPQPPR